MSPRSFQHEILSSRASVIRWGPVTCSRYRSLLQNITLTYRKLSRCKWQLSAHSNLHRHSHGPVPSSYLLTRVRSIYIWMLRGKTATPCGVHVPDCVLLTLGSRRVRSTTTRSKTKDEHREHRMLKSAGMKRDHSQQETELHSVQFPANRREKSIFLYLVLLFIWSKSHQRYPPPAAAVICVRLHT